MIIKTQKAIKIINTCNCIVNESLLKKAILWFAHKPVYFIKIIFMYGCYPAVSIYDKKIHVHRLLLMYLRNNKKLPLVSHHKNGNKLDNRLTNLILYHPSRHASLHNKGKVISAEHRKKIGDKNRLRKGTKYKINKNPELLEGK